jgi:hypothetical protein
MDMRKRRGGKEMERGGRKGLNEGDFCGRRRERVKREIENESVLERGRGGLGHTLGKNN